MERVGGLPPNPRQDTDGSVGPVLAWDRQQLEVVYRSTQTRHLARRGVLAAPVTLVYPAEPDEEEISFVEVDGQIVTRLALLRRLANLGVASVPIDLVPLLPGALHFD